VLQPNDSSDLETPRSAFALLAFGRGSKQNVRSPR